MLLPKQIKNSQSGQILIIFLLILVVGLAIVLSIASRTVTDVRQTTTSDESNRAYYAAESGVQDALKKISDGTIPGTTYQVNLSNVNRASADVTAEGLSVLAGQAFEFPDSISKDDVGQVNLLENFNDITSASDTAVKSTKIGDQLVVYWRSSTPVEGAIEVSIITCVGSPNCTTSSAFKISKFTFDPLVARAGASNFCSTVGGSSSINTTVGDSRTFEHSAIVKFTGSTCGGINDDVAVVNGPNNHPVLARIRLLYNSSPVPVAVKAQSFGPPAVNKVLPDQGSKVTSVGSTPSGVTRKLTVTRLYPALPAIFDYVLYNGGTSALSKP